MDPTTQERELAGYTANKLTIRHVLVVLTGILVCFGPATLVFNTWSIMVVPVCTSLDVPTNSFTFYVSMIFVASAIAAPFAGNLMERYDVRVVITGACGLCALGLILCSFYTEVWQFYVSGAIEGTGVVVLVSLVAPTLVNRWFQAHTGMLVGLCVAMMGIGAAVWNMLGGVILNAYDWRMCYLVFGIIAAAISMPATMFFIRSYPEDVGLEPYGKISGESETEAFMQSGIEAKKAFRMPVFFLLCITIALFNGVAQMGNYLAKYVYHLSDIGVIGLSVAEVVILASIASTCLSVSQACGKVGLGIIGDRSIKVALVIACVCGFSGVLLCWQGAAVSYYSVYAGAVLFGILFASTNVLGPTITRYLFGPRDYTIIYSRVAIVVNLFPVFFVPMYATLADFSWDALFGVAACIVAVIFACALLLIRLAKRIPKD